ncbi:hypothetical protein [Ulvibacterium sp.]|uniref:hypothetical protein n=1 Tax=Ulvibacterium sp. TaxID=2665914 RepID=UPI003BAC2523
MKTTQIFLFALFCCSMAWAQSYTPLHYHLNGTPTNGIKIKTNLPFQNNALMPTIIIEGYNYGRSGSIGIMLNWYIYNGDFINFGASSHGTFAPTIKLSNENGNVIIYIDSREYFNRFQIRAFAKGLPQDLAVNYQGWTAVDEPLTGTNTVDVPYRAKINGQSIWTENGANINYGVGNVGIGTTNPAARLQVHINGDQRALRIKNDANNAQFNLWTTETGSIKQLRLDEDTTGSTVATFSDNGNVGIGTTAPDDKLTVKGRIHAEEVKVDLSVPGPDYVFKEGYDLKSLEEVQHYIKEKGHLPNIPSAQEMEENGVELGIMNMKLLEKIEELTLYQLQLLQQLEASHMEIEKLKIRVEHLEGK